MLMERTEPALAPEWLRCTGNVTDGGSSVHHSDASSASSARSKSFRINNEKDSSPRYLNRSSSFDSKRSSVSNGSAKHPYSSFSRSHRDKKWDKEKGKPFSDDVWEHDSSDLFGSILNHRVDKSGLRHSRSLVSRIPGETLPQKKEGSWTGGSSNLSVTQKGAFEKNFPSLGKEEKQGLARTGTGLSSSSHILPAGNSGFLSPEKWTSALAEVPLVNGDDVVGNSSLQRNVAASSNSSSGVSSTIGLNMAEALSQPTVRTRETTQLPDKNQRLEELAIKQSRQLIPVTSSMPKPMVPSLGDKSKHRKPTVSSEATVAASRTGHALPHSSHLANLSHTAQIRNDSTTTHAGKFLVLKSSREMGTATTTAKNTSCANSDVNGSIIANGQQAMDISSPKTSTNLSNSTVSSLGNKAAALSLSSWSNADKRTASQSLAQSRSEFFNLMRKKNSSHLATSLSDPSSAVSRAKAATSKEMIEQAAGSLVRENGVHMNCNGNSQSDSEKSKGSSDIEDDNELYSSATGSLYPDEEEAAFLRSLGWEENGGEDEGLTEEEINAFYQEYMRRTPTLKLCRSFEPKCSALAKLQAISGITTSSDSTTKTEPGA